MRTHTAGHHPFLPCFFVYPQEVWTAKSPLNLVDSVQQSSGVSSTVHFHGVDISKVTTLPSLPRQQSDGGIQLCTFFWFVCEMRNLQQNFRPLFRNLMETVAPGCVLMFMDSSEPKARSFMTVLFKDNSDLLEEDTQMSFEVALPPPVKSLWRPFTADLGLLPRLGGAARLYLWRKKASGN
eukprot:TRINITY_DN63608_c0_g1_i2.p1 TRINITY_DN63608_c0_g1~~TRINITY_DN63608_c0_g1_i2.p1  ORF type:complete len:181 (-),score=8.89 TRINITY_DN63608_c0_g1_i2:148-690(-)